MSRRCVFNNADLYFNGLYRPSNINVEAISSKHLHNMILKCKVTHWGKTVMCRMISVRSSQRGGAVLNCFNLPSSPGGLVFPEMVQ